MKLKQTMKQKIQHDTQLPFVQHLLELRNRLLLCLSFVVIVFLALYPFSNDLYLIVSSPLTSILPDNTSMIATGVASPFLTPFKLTFMTAVFSAMPLILFQIWKFISPALSQSNSRLGLPLFIGSIFLFYLGMVFAYWIVFPLIFGFFTTIAPQGVSIMTDISNYLDFIIKLFFAFGLVFEIPIVTVILIITGITSSKKLSEKRPYLIVIFFVVGMLLTPPDILSQTLLAAPMWLLFELGLILSKVIEKSRALATQENQKSSA